MQAASSGGQICYLCKWRHLEAKFATNASDAMLLQNLVQVTESISGSVVPLAMFFIFTQPKATVSQQSLWITTIICLELKENHVNSRNCCVSHKQRHNAETVMLRAGSNAIRKYMQTRLPQVVVS